MARFTFPNSSVFIQNDLQLVGVRYETERMENSQPKMITATATEPSHVYYFLLTELLLAPANTVYYQTKMDT
jgi:hypothetical protein